MKHVKEIALMVTMWLGCFLCICGAVYAGMHEKKDLCDGLTAGAFLFGFFGLLASQDE